jgi:hypothetical protein
VVSIARNNRKRSGGGGQGEEMTQTMYAHVNKWIIKFLKKEKDQSRLPLCAAEKKNPWAVETKIKTIK